MTKNLREQLAHMGIQPKKSLGQNFLVSEHVINKIVQECLNHSHDKTFEIGPGLGALTLPLLDKGENLTLFELDTKLAKYWRQQNVEVIEGDALKWNWSQLDDGGQYLLVSNLPYQISSSLVVDLCSRGIAIKTMVLMFQKEVAQRIMAQPSSKDYGLLTVMAQVFWQVKNLLEAGPQAFYPPPKVASRVLVFDRKAMPVAEPGEFLAMVKAAFAQRRKLVTKNLTQWQGHSRSTVLEILRDLGFSENTRAEQIAPDQFVRLYQALRGV